jgi:hypothetical protein
MIYSFVTGAIFIKHFSVSRFLQAITSLEFYSLFQTSTRRMTMIAQIQRENYSPIKGWGFRGGAQGTENMTIIFVLSMTSHLLFVLFLIGYNL